MKRNLKYLLILLGVTLFFLGYQYFKHAGLKAYQYVGKSEVARDSLPDGQYSGAFSPFNLLPLAKVHFQVENGKVKDFAIPRLMVSPWNRIRPSVTDSIRKNQSVHFDAITGATRSSYFIKAAVKKACEQQPTGRKEARP